MMKLISDQLQEEIDKAWILSEKYLKENKTFLAAMIQKDCNDARDAIKSGNTLKITKWYDKMLHTNTLGI